MEALPFRATLSAAPYAPIHRLPVAVVLHCVRSLYNVGAFFRTGDAAGIERLYLTGYTGCPPHRGIAKTALGAEETLPWERRDQPSSLVADLRERGWQIAVIETSTRAVDLYDWEPAFPVCLVFGNEVDGVDVRLAEAADVQVRVPMLGRKQSLNVAVAGGVVLFELLRQYRERHTGGSVSARLDKTAREVK
ncbi:MAG: TrmH family RNA methyltransferase [Luteitalea sp.]|nr:TrmH family RNA methyltransferase [Luteitalea sp.]